MRLFYENKKDVYDPLVESDSDCRLFSTYKDLFLLAACIGFEKKKRSKMSAANSDKGEIHWQMFERNNADLATINSIALASTCDIDIILDTDDMIDRKIKIMEEYANGGIHVIKEKILDMPGDLIDNLVNFIFEEVHEEVQEEEEIGILEELESELYE